eukprot:gene330-biopygen306
MERALRQKQMTVLPARRCEDWLADEDPAPSESKRSITHRISAVARVNRRWEALLVAGGPPPGHGITLRSARRAPSAQGSAGGRSTASQAHRTAVSVLKESNPGATPAT